MPPDNEAILAILKNEFALSIWTQTGMKKAKLDIG